MKKHSRASNAVSGVLVDYFCDNHFAEQKYDQNDLKKIDQKDARLLQICVNITKNEMRHVDFGREQHDDVKPRGISPHQKKEYLPVQTPNYPLSIVV